jgi:hypothetical protein
MLVRRSRQLGPGDLFDFSERHRHAIAALVFQVFAEGAVFRRTYLRM